MQERPFGATGRCKRLLGGEGWSYIYVCRSVKMQERTFEKMCERLLRGEGWRSLQNAFAPEREQYQERLQNEINLCRATTKPLKTFPNSST